MPDSAAPPSPADSQRSVAPRQDAGAVNGTCYAHPPLRVAQHHVAPTLAHELEVRMEAMLHQLPTIPPAMLGSHQEYD
eukprot:CAMPEP_0204489578 /NCGR_PEP_ID=MMETSP0471-20130131/72600_1 /ASSEMBLY_ACC=CAM_ASM_000602 /TAXON_ID=2969 /ORGANISM="Oxyrrhis marina" /LENGTH=77 /DNA_ID=CAMNT_0051493445 /DNA_START=359 /DNA_END=593 /DNA_ORIENTATION=+